MHTNIIAVVYDPDLKLFDCLEVTLECTRSEWTADLVPHLLHSLAKKHANWKRVLEGNNTAFLFNTDTKEGITVYVHQALSKDPR